MISRKDLELVNVQFFLNRSDCPLKIDHFNKLQEKARERNIPFRTYAAEVLKKEAEKC
jgi:hypothetical protein